MTDQNDQEPRIIVDDDWKAQAQREKEELDRQAQEDHGEQLPPEPSILEIVQILVMQATVALGLVQDPQTGQPIPPHLPLAKHYIDLIELLEQKTQGNLDASEKSQIDSVLHQLRMVFVELSGAGPAGQRPAAGGGAPQG